MLNKVNLGITSLEWKMHINFEILSDTSMHKHAQFNVLCSEYQ